MTDKPSLVFFGNEKLATGIADQPYVLQKLIDEGYEVVAIVLSQKPRSSSRDMVPAVESIAHAYEIPVIYFADEENLVSELKTLPTELGVVVAYGRILRPNLMQLFTHGLINIHPSLLPRYRGPSPIEQTILDGTTDTGVSIIVLGDGVDDGPIIVQKKITIGKRISKAELADKLLRVGGDLLIDIIPDYITGVVKLAPQDESKATMTHKLNRANQKLDLNLTSEQLDCVIRAQAGWPGSTIVFENSLVMITEAHDTKVSFNQAGLLCLSDHKLYISCGTGSLEVIRLKQEGKSEISAQDFLNSHPKLKKKPVLLSL